MSTNKELLELAAKAAGIEIEPCTCKDPKFPFRLCGVRKPHWNPLANNSDALRLAVKLRLDIHFEEQMTIGEIVEIFYLRDELGMSCMCEMQPLADDPMAAVRLAIVNAAAEIGRKMP